MSNVILQASGMQKSYRLGPSLLRVDVPENLIPVRDRMLDGGVERFRGARLAGSPWIVGSARRRLILRTGNRHTLEPH